MQYFRPSLACLPCSRPALQLPVLAQFGLLLLLLFQHALAAAPAAAASKTDAKLFVTDADMGIYSYDSIVQVSGHPVNVRLDLRFMCNGELGGSGSVGSAGSTASTDSTSSSSSIGVHGFASTYLLTTKPPPWAPGAPHYYPLDIQQHLKVSISSREGSTPIHWVGSKDWGLWRLKGQLSGPGPFRLEVSGASTVQDLPHPLCQQQHQQQQHLRRPDLSGGIWNVLTTTSNSSLAPKELGFLVMQHHTYHRSVGLHGTILRSNLQESKQLARLPDVRKAIEQENLIVWPWEHEHVASWSTHYWQRPKNQLTLLGAYGRNARLAFFDLDEYLVLPHRATVADAQCLGRPLLDETEAGGMGSWTFIRFQAKTCPDKESDMPCWEAGASVTSPQEMQLLHDVCPMSSSHGKQVMVADMVDSVSVHFTESKQYQGNKAIDASCGHLLHFYSLLEGRRAGVSAILRKLPSVAWSVDPVLGRRQLVWPEGLVPMSYETCTKTTSARLDAVIAYKKAYKAKHGVIPLIGQPPPAPAPALAATAAHHSPGKKKQKKKPRRAGKKAVV